MTDRELKDAAAATPDPDRAYKNLLTFLDRSPDCAGRLRQRIKPIALLFSFSQFLANFSASNPEALFDAMDRINEPLDSATVSALLRKELLGFQASTDALSGIVRVFKKKILLLITLRDILGKADLQQTMQELSSLAEIIVHEALAVLHARLMETFGRPEDDAFSVIAVGKLGGDELNFSSDIDLLYVYRTEEGETSGVMTHGGVITNRISNHEFYCKLGENLSRFLSANTEEGFAYRVDLRLRPQGQRGSIAMSLSAYEIYYESWGRAWERAVFLRARPIAGDAGLGREFTEMLKPFVYRKYLDFSAIDEIKNMKTRIDAAFKKDDIKRGFGGIREIEFFVHALQLIYSGREHILRERNLLKALHRLLQKNIIGRGDYSELSDNYIFMRLLEHRLQQLNDIQTHSLPAPENELAALGRKMGFRDLRAFTEELENRRKAVHRIYDSLFTEKQTEKPLAASSVFFIEDLPDKDMQEALKPYPVKDIKAAMRNIRSIRYSTHTFQTIRGRRLLNETLPDFLQEALRAGNPDVTLKNLASFAELLASEESYLEMFSGNKALIPILVRIFSRSEYLSKAIIKRVEYLALLGHEMFLKNTLGSLEKNLQQTIDSGQSLADAIRILKQTEEIRLGVLFLDKKTDTIRLIKELSHTAEAIVSVCTEHLAPDTGLSVIGMGKAGARELNFSSDLDLIFTCREEVSDKHIKAAERLIRLLMSYTKDGPAYSVDTRLRPDGTRGLLVQGISTFKNYYAGAAQFWELQALLKARPLGGDKASSCLFMEMRADILRKRGRAVKAADIKGMRERVCKEVSKEKQGYDIKLGPGGIEELEFLIQYLQLNNCEKNEGLLVQGTLDAIRRLTGAGIINKETGCFLREAYLLYRTIEIFLRLSGEAVLRKDSSLLADISGFMGFKDSEDLLENVREKREKTVELFNRFLAASVQ